MPSYDLTCAQCGIAMAHAQRSLPQGEATCRACRRRLHKSDTGPRRYPSREMPCAVCGHPMIRSRASLPEGQATCMPCRRKARGRGPYETKPRSNGWAPEARECPICQVVFEQTRANQVYCSAECRQSRTNWTYAKVATASERGYGKEHREERARWKPIVEAGQAYCCLCGYWIEPGSKWHLDHNEERTGYRGAAHARCNIRDGARRGNRAMPRPKLEKACDGCARPFLTIYPRQRYCSRECKPKRAAKQKPMQVTRYCADCQAQIGKGRRCAACANVYNRVAARNAYRLRVGIPLDAPLHSRAG